jgi:hypothetical protein
VDTNKAGFLMAGIMERQLEYVCSYFYIAGNRSPQLLPFNQSEEERDLSII